MNQIHNLVLVGACLLAGLTGCSTSTEAPQFVKETPSITKSSSSNFHDPAKYEFHRNVEFTEVSKNMPSGSVDHIDFNMAAAPNVVVVVTVTAPPTDNLRFTTTFTGPNDLSIVKEWKPAGSADNKHVGLFILPDSVTAGSTVAH